VTRKESAVRKAAEQKFPAHASKLDRHSGLSCVLETLVLGKGDQPFPFRDKATREFDDSFFCILDQVLVTFENRAARQRGEAIPMGAGRCRALKPLDEGLYRSFRFGRARFLRIRWAAEEGADLHLECVAGTFAHEAAEQEGVDVTLHDRPATEGHLWRGEGPLQVGPRIAERFAVEWPVFAESERQRHGLAASAGAADALPIVGD
jgi:hypothetical protein